MCRSVRANAGLEPPWISKRLVELAQVTLRHFDGFHRRWRIPAAYRVVVATAASFVVTHLPVVVILISVDELPADHDANDIYGAHFPVPFNSSGQR
jgi:hypothetical protein